MFPLELGSLTRSALLIVVKEEIDESIMASAHPP